MSVRRMQSEYLHFIEQYDLELCQSYQHLNYKF